MLQQQQLNLPAALQILHNIYKKTHFPINSQLWHLHRKKAVAVE
jgi:hypothetical protein